MTMQPQSPEQQLSPWADAFGPLLTEAAVRRQGIDPDTTGLLTITSQEGDRLYPLSQFNGNAPEGFVTSPVVENAWNTIVLPAIEEGIVDPYTIVAYLCNTGPDGISTVDAMRMHDLDEERASLVVTALKNTIHRMSQ